MDKKPTVEVVSKEIKNKDGEVIGYTFSGTIN